MAELKAGGGQPFDTAVPPRGNSRNGLTSGNTTISVTVVGEFVQWNEEAIARCTVLTPQVLSPSLVLFRSLFLGLLPLSLSSLLVLTIWFLIYLQATLLATYVRAIFLCLLDQVPKYL